MSLIRMNYDEVIASADKLLNLVNQGEQYLKEFMNMSESIPSIWTGEASNAFVGLCGQCQREMNELIVSLNTISSNVRFTANEIKAADERARLAAEASMPKK